MPYASSLYTGTPGEGSHSTTTISMAAIAGLDGIASWSGCPVIVNSGTGAGQVAIIASYSSNVITLDRTWSLAVDGSSNLSIYAAPSSAGFSDLYHADVNFTRDQTNSQDEWTVMWFKNGVAVTSGITTPLLQLIKRADGTNLLGSTAMTAIGSTGALKLNATSDNRLTKGEAVIVLATATIDGAARTWRKLMSRDSQ